MEIAVATKVTVGLPHAAPSMNQFESASIKLLSSLVLVYSVFIFVCVQFELYIFTTSSQCLYTKYPLTT